MAKRKSAKTELTPSASASAPTRTRRASAAASAPAVALRVAPTNGPRQPARQEPASPQQAQKTPPRAAASAKQPADQPKRTRKSGSRRFVDLREALADGWEIVQPIFARPLWSVTDDSQTAFNFVLRRDQATRLLTIPHSRTVERFIASHSLQVDERR